MDSKIDNHVPSEKEKESTNTKLLDSVGVDDIGQVKAALAEEADVDARNEDGYTALKLARERAAYGDIAKQIEEAGGTV